MPNVVESTDAAASSATQYSLRVGETAQGNLATSGDHDWYRVDLVAGQSYTFAMTGTGSSNVINPFLRLYSSSNTVVASIDDGLQGQNAIFTYTASTTGTFYIDAGSANNGTGQYGISFTSGNRASFDVQMGAGVMDTDLAWTSTPGTGANVTYAFRSTDSGDEPGFSRLTTAEIAAVRQILTMYSEICGLTFSEVNPGGYSDNATMLFSNYRANDGAGAYAYYPGSTAASARNGDVYLNLNSVSTSALPAGSWSYAAVAHEIGHAVGLSHPGKYNAALGVTITYAQHAQFVQDSEQYSIMSYFDESVTSGVSSGYSSSPDALMLYDVYALQQIYGANNSTRAGDTVYGFASNAGGIYDFSANANPAMCIWDGGGNDTLNISGFANAQVINLNGGTFSNIGALRNNVSIALGAVIENVVGGSGGDTIHLTTAGTSNSVNGGGGSDTVYVSYAYGSAYAISGIATNFTMTGAAGNDTLQNVEYVVFTSGERVATSSLMQPLPISVSISDVTLTEGDSGTRLATFTVSRTGGTSAFSVNYTTSNGTATAGTDYVARSGTLSFAAGVNSQTVTVTVNGDTAVEANETFFVDLSTATNGATIVDGRGQATITDDDTAGSVSISDVTVTEGNSGSQLVTFTVTRTGGSDAFTVGYQTQANTALAGSDFVSKSGTLSFAAGVNSQTVTVSVVGDVTVEPNETFFVNLINPTNGIVIADAQGVATIIDNDLAGSISISDVTITEGNSSTRLATFTVTRTGGSAAFAVNYSTSDGTATSGSDYVARATSTLSFAAGVNSRTVTVTINGDTTPEGNETFYVNLSGATNGAIIADAQGVGTIVNDENAGTIAISDVTITEGNSGTQIATFTVTRTGGTGAFSVDFATADGSAASSGDYVSQTGTLSFGMGVMSQTVSVVINGDTAAEANETFYINLSNATAGATITDSQGQGLIVDNDQGADDYADTLADVTAPRGSITVNGTATGSLETGGDHDIFSLSLAAGGTITVDLLGTEGGGGTLIDPYCYLYNSSGVIVARDDDAGDGLNSRIVYTPTAAGTYYVDAGAFSDAYAGTYRINVNGSTGPGSVSISDVIITEGNSGTKLATFTVTRSGGTTAFTVGYATASGSATAGSDFVSRSGTINFAANVNSQTVTVTINGDTLSEGDETFNVNLTTATNGAVIADGQGQGLIVNDDGAGDDYADSRTDTTAPKGNIALNGSSTGTLETVGDHDWFLVSLTAGVTTTIDLRGLDTGSGTLSDPYLRLYNSAGTLIYSDDDSGDGLNSRLVYTPTVTGTYYIDAAAYANSYIGTYRLDVSGNTSPGNVAISDVTITEGNSGTKLATFTMTRSGGTGAFSVDYYTSDGSAMSGSDYIYRWGTINFAAGVNSQTLTATINGDTTAEQDETFYVNLWNATNSAVITDATGQGLIINDDIARDDYANWITGTSPPVGLVYVDGYASGNLGAVGDHDMFRVSLSAGQTVRIDLQGADSYSGTLDDPYLRIYNSTGTLLNFDDDSGIGWDSSLVFTAGAAGSYYIDAGSYYDSSVGTYWLSVTSSSFLPTATTVAGSADLDTTHRLGTLRNDVLVGTRGDDWLSGGDGSDRLRGRGGADILNGGQGTDLFVYAGLTDSAPGASDTILDFQSGIDRIDLSLIDANRIRRGNQAFEFAGQNSAPKAFAVTWLEDASARNTIVQVDNDGNAATIEMELILKGLGLNLQASDFRL